jgi:MFS transporter, DHA2 family, multidrug resistance protein
MATFAMGVVVAPVSARPRRLDHGQLFVALDFLHQPASRLLAIFLAEWLVEDPPYIKRNLKAAIDFVGFGLLAVWLATLQIVLDKGQEADWLGAVWICWFTITSVPLIAFIAWEFYKDPLVDLRVFKNQNFPHVGVI